MSTRTVLFAAILSVWLGLAPFVRAEDPPPQVSPRRQLDPGGGMVTGAPRWANINGVPTSVRPEESLNAGIFVPDGRGGYIWTGSHSPMTLPNPEHEAARELKLKVRELADQLLNGETETSIAGSIALPASFVSQDDFSRSSSFGRYIAEQMFYEFHQRGVPVREYRQVQEIVAKPDQGDLMLTRNAGNIRINSPRAAVLVGTYYSDRYNVFVNARLINGATGMVLRTGLLVFPQTKLSRRMLASATIDLGQGAVGIRDYRTMLEASTQVGNDIGQDIH